LIAITGPRGKKERGELLSYGWGEMQRRGWKGEAVYWWGTWETKKGGGSEREVGSERGSFILEKVVCCQERANAP